MSELKKILWKLYYRRDYIDLQTNRCIVTEYMDKSFWLGEKVANDRAIFIIKKSIRKVECIS